MLSVRRLGERPCSYYKKQQSIMEDKNGIAKLTCKNHLTPMHSCCRDVKVYANGGYTRYKGVTEFNLL